MAVTFPLRVEVFVFMDGGEHWCNDTVKFDIAFRLAEVTFLPF